MWYRDNKTATWFYEQQIAQLTFENEQLKSVLQVAAAQLNSNDLDAVVRTLADPKFVSQSDSHPRITNVCSPGVGDGGQDSVSQGVQLEIEGPW